MNRVFEDIVYGNTSITSFVSDTLIQPRNEINYLSTDVKEKGLDMQKVAHMLKYFGSGENRPVNGTYFGLKPESAKNRWLMPEYYN